MQYISCSALSERHIVKFANMHLDKFKNVYSIKSFQKYIYIYIFSKIFINKLKTTIYYNYTNFNFNFKRCINQVFSLT